MERVGAKKRVLSLVAVALCCAAAFCDTGTAYVQGLNAYRTGDWTSATFFLRRAITDGSASTPDAWFMLVNSQMYDRDYRTAISDCATFLDLYPDSPLAPYIQYQRGRALHFTGRNDDAVSVLSDFCHHNPGHELYASALYWIAECFFDDYAYSTAAPLYERVVAEFASDEKAEDSQFKLGLIEQKEREEKLLYLLKVTGEESLSAREEYEKQLRQYQSEDADTLRRQLQSQSQRIADLERELSERSDYVPPNYYEDALEVDDEADEKAHTLAELKEKADLVEKLLIQSLIDERNSYPGE